MTHFKKYWLLYSLLAIVVVVVVVSNWTSISNYFTQEKLAQKCKTSDGKDGVINNEKVCVPLIAAEDAGRVMAGTNIITQGTPSAGRWTCFGAGFAYHSSRGCKSGEFGYYQN